MTGAARLARLLNELPDDAMLPVAWLRTFLQASHEPEQPADGQPAGDMDVEAFAAFVGRKPSTVRTWLAADLVPGAYKLRGKTWRIPVWAARAFLDRERERHTHGTDSEEDAVDIGEWRKLRGLK